MQAKLIGGGIILILIVLAGWQYTRQATKIGELEQANSTLDQAVKDGEKNYNTMKKLVALTASEVIKVEKQKAILNNYALKKMYELETLKNENEDVKIWAISLLPDLIGYRLFDFANNNHSDRLPGPAVGVVTTDTGTRVIIQNETLYRYAIDGITALRSCNADKLGLTNFYKLNEV